MKKEKPKVRSIRAIKQRLNKLRNVYVNESPKFNRSKRTRLTWKIKELEWVLGERSE